MTLTPTPAAPSGELLKWALRELLTTLPRPRDWLNPDAEGVLRDAFNALAAPSGAPKQPPIPLYSEYTPHSAWAAASTVQSAPAKDDADPIGDFHAEDRQAKLDDFVASMQSAPVLSACLYVECRECTRCNHVGINDADEKLAACHNCDWSGPSPVEDHCPGCADKGCMGAACPKCGANYTLLVDSTVAAQSTPVQVEGQQEPQAHVMPPFAAPASQPDARDPNWLLSTMDGKDWADEFCRMNNAADHGMMLGWFCNAIMTGYDTGRRHEADEQSSTAGAAKGGIDEPNGAVQALALPVAAAPEQKP